MPYFTGVLLLLLLKLFFFFTLLSNPLKIMSCPWCKAILGKHEQSVFGSVFFWYEGFCSCVTNNQKMVQRITFIYLLILRDNRLFFAVGEAQVKTITRMMVELHLAASVSGSWNMLAHCDDLLVHINRREQPLMLLPMFFRLWHIKMSAVKKKPLTDK